MNAPQKNARRRTRATAAAFARALFLLVCVCVEGTDVRRLLSSPEVSKHEEEKARPPLPRPVCPQKLQSLDPFEPEAHK